MVPVSGFCLGPHVITTPVLLAPMSGVTDAAMRRLASGMGAGLVVSEMVASDALLRGEQESRLRADGAGLDLHVVQLAGCNADWMASAAQFAVANGAAVIDINMGCPAKKVTGGWAGSALMRELDHAVRLIDAVASAVAVPVTVKMRLGWDHESINAPELARRAEQAGAQMITVHGRTRQQFYKGQADWSAIAAVKAEIGIPLIANGDILTLDDARQCLAQSGADGVMIGRAALGRAWLPGAIGEALSSGATTMAVPGPARRAELAIAHYQGLLTAMGIMAVRHARKHLAAYADDAAQGQAPDHIERFQETKAALLTSEDPDQVLHMLQELFDDTPANGWPSRIAAGIAA
jgi:tRNA-dihydrouridine synthase B